MGLKMLKDTGNVAAAWGSFIAFLGGLNLGDWASIFGILFGLFTVLMNWYYKHRDLKIKEKALQNQIDLEKLKWKKE